jgi:serine/threonine protein kinase
MEARTIAAEELVNAERFTDGTPVYRVDAHTVVKTGDCVRLVEAAAMKLVREKTAIPVPEVYNAYTDPNSGHAMIVMEFIEGDRLADVWSKFSTDQKQQIIEQLCDFSPQLHNLKESFIGSVDGTACEDPLFDEIIGGYGPYHDEAAFNDGIMKSLKDTSTGGWVNTVCDMVGALKDHEIVLTHGDISPRNILV